MKPPTIDDVLSLLAPPHIVIRDVLRELVHESDPSHLHNVACELSQACQVCETCNGNEETPCGECEVRMRASVLLTHLTMPEAWPVRSAAVVDLAEHRERRARSELETLLSGVDRDTAREALRRALQRFEEEEAPPQQ